MDDAQIEVLVRYHREQNVGVASDGDCVICGEEWPCPVVQLATALRESMRPSMDDETARWSAAMEAVYPSTPLNVMARTINRLAELLPKDHECERIFAEFDAVGEYVRELEEANDAHAGEG